MKRTSLFIKGVQGSLLLFITVWTVAAQSTKTTITPAAKGGSDMWTFVLVLVTAGALGLAYFFWKKSQAPQETTNKKLQAPVKHRPKTRVIDAGAVDSDRELDWLRKAKRPVKRTAVPRAKVQTTPSAAASAAVEDPAYEIGAETRLFQEKMRKLQYAQLPINSFSTLKPAKLYEPLPMSDDPAVLDAIEQANEEYEDDEVVREVAVKILTAFRTRNSVEALSQIALYDLSSSLRSKAVSTLTDFDHESVFEAILLACADPTREVRAAAARGLFRLNFDRADAWKRIMETNDKFRMSHAARAALEAGIVVKSFDRLVHEDLKVAYEAFCLVSLLIKADETDAIFEALKNHRDERVKFALLHVLKVHKDERTLEYLNEVHSDADLTTDVAERVRETIASFEHAMA